MNPFVRISARQLILWNICLLTMNSLCATRLPMDKTSVMVRKNIAYIEYGQIDKAEITPSITVINDETIRIEFVINATTPIHHNDWSVHITPTFKPTFHWAPHLTPTDEHIIDQHSFRAPAMIGQGGGHVTLLCMPDLQTLTHHIGPRWYIDMNAVKNEFTLGMSEYKVTDHVLYQRDTGAVYPKGKTVFAFYLTATNNPSVYQNPFRPILHYYWTHFGSQKAKEITVSTDRFMQYAEYTYRWAFEHWADAVWQEFKLDGKRVGAPTFIVNTTQSPNYPGEVNEREFRSIWNQAWFCSLRSASGLYRYAKRTGNKEWLHKANQTKELALSFPQKNGLFYGLVATEMEQINKGGKKVNRSLGWENSLYWGNSNRNPFTNDPKRSPFHLLDMSWTALQMMRWYDELEKDTRLLVYAGEYADALLRYQTPEGFFPAWVEMATLQPYSILTQSPETSLSVTFLLHYANTTGKTKYKEAALKALRAVTNQILPYGRWEDFETYWSCCRFGQNDLVGKKVERNNMYKQCNFSMFWTAEALLEAYKTTGDKQYLEWGQRTLDELLMTQATWQPPYMYVDVIGGFGVMNCDGEWNDARQSLFAPLIIEYGQLLQNNEYTERGMAALNASFAMMYCPLNTKAKKQWEAAWPFFNEKDYGFMMENYGHGGKTGDGGIGIGEFTIYDWGNGSASEAYMRILDKMGKPFFDEYTTQ